MSSTPSMDARAVAKALAALTTQVKRIADSRQGDFILSDDDATTAVYCPLCPEAPRLLNPADATDHFRAQHPEQRLNTSGAWPLLVTDDGPTTPATTCSAQYNGVLPVGECIRAAGHIAVTDHTDDRGRKWGDTVAFYPPADSTVRVAHWHPASEQRNEEQQELAGKVSEFIDAQVQQARAAGIDPSPEWLRRGSRDLSIREQAPAAGDVECRRMETRTCPLSYNGPCGDRPCARFESDDPTPWLDTAAPLTVDEVAPNMLRVLVDRAARGVLNESEGEALRCRVEQMINGRTTWKAKAEEIEHERDRTAAELTRSENARDHLRRRAKTAERDLRTLRTGLRAAGGDPTQIQNLWAQLRLRNRQWAEAKREAKVTLSMLEEEGGDVRLVDEMLATVANAEARARETQAVIERVRKALDDRPPCFDGKTGQPASSYEAGWRDHDRMVRYALDGTEQQAEASRGGLAEYQAAVARVAKVLVEAERHRNQTHPSERQDCVMCGADHFAEALRAIDGTEQPTRGNRLCHATDPTTLRECALRHSHEGDHQDGDLSWPTEQPTTEA
ncbi:hypothetical protein ACW4TU_30320 [Streptomyces sp. QTS52]